MDNNTLLKTQTNFAENSEEDTAVKINQKIDDIQSLLNDRQQQDVDKKEEITVWANEAVEIINASVVEEEILKNLEGLYKKIQGNEDQKLVSEIEESVKHISDKEIPLHPRLKQEVTDIIHTSGRGIPMFVSNNMKKTATDIGITIEDKDKPDDVIEKMKKRLGGESTKEITSPSIIQENILSEETPIIEDKKEVSLVKERIIEPVSLDNLSGFENETESEKEIITEPTASEISSVAVKETKQKGDEERVSEVKKQIEELLNSLNSPQKKELVEKLVPTINPKNIVFVKKEETVPIIEEPESTFVIEKKEITPEIEELENSVIVEKEEIVPIEEEPAQTFIIDEEQITPAVENSVILKKEEEETPIIEPKRIIVTEKKQEDVVPKRITVSDQILAKLG